MADPRDLLGKQVIVQNPDVVSARWGGRAIAYTDRPTLLIEQPNGLRLMLPAEWAAPAPIDDDPYDDRRYASIREARRDTERDSP